MRAREADEQRLGLGRQADQDTPTIRPVGDTLNQTRLLQPIGELDRAVVANMEPGRESPHRHRLTGRKPLDLHQRLMLARGQPRVARRDLAEFDKTAKKEAEFGERDVIHRRPLARDRGLTRGWGQRDPRLPTPLPEVSTVIVHAPSGFPD